MPIMPEILIIPLINFAKGASRTGSASHTGSRSTAGGEKLANGEGLRSSERNGKVRKRGGRVFDEKRV